MQQTELIEALDNLIFFARHLRQLPPQEIVTKSEELEKHLRDIRYFARNVVRQPSIIQEPTKVIPAKCSFEACVNKMPLFNVKANLRQIDWRCVYHIPKDLTFPMGLYNEEWITSGREVPKPFR